MSYVPRTYEAIVRDLLTTLTGGTVRESITVPTGDGPLLLPKLANRPVRRVSHLEGVTLVGRGATERRLPYRFTAADFELVSVTGNDDEKDSIVFRKDGRRPVPGTTLTVNYYPVQTGPVPLTDLNVGSVTRTVMETAGREQALAYLNLDFIYKSGYLDSAESSSLDKVIALIGVSRLPPGHPVARLQFSRREGTPGRITIPSGTVVTDDAAPVNRYLTLDALTLEPYESVREVLAGGESPATGAVEAGTLTRPEILIAGISTVTNPQPAHRLTAPETDDELRRRARGALSGVVRGTVDALRFGLRSIPGVKDVGVVEAPNGVYGEIRLDIAYSDPSPATRDAVRRRIDELRPAGIRVIPADAGSVRVTVRVELTLAGTGVAQADLAGLTAAAEARLAEYLSTLPPGGQIRRARMVSLILSDARIADARVVLVPAGQDETEELTLPEGQVLDVARPFSFPAPTSEQAPGPAPASTATVSAALPIHLVAGVTLTNASAAINTALASHLGTRRPDAPLTVDGLAAAIRDDTRFALVRANTIVTVESGGRFLQLTDGVGSYAPAPNETLQSGTIEITPDEAGA